MLNRSGSDPSGITARVRCSIRYRGAGTCRHGVPHAGRRDSAASRPFRDGSQHQSYGASATAGVRLDPRSSLRWAVLTASTLIGHQHAIRRALSGGRKRGELAQVRRVGVVVGTREVVAGGVLVGGGDAGEAGRVDDDVEHVGDNGWAQGLQECSDVLCRDGGDRNYGDTSRRGAGDGVDRVVWNAQVRSSNLT